MRQYRGFHKTGITVTGKSAGKWVYGYYVKAAGDSYVIPTLYHEMARDFDSYKVLPETVGEFVCKDKNGKDVFAGDGVVWQENYTGTIVFLEDLLCWAVCLDIEGKPIERLKPKDIELIEE